MQFYDSALPMSLQHRPYVVALLLNQPRTVLGCQPIHSPNLATMDWLIGANGQVTVDLQNLGHALEVARKLEEEHKQGQLNLDPEPEQRMNDEETMYKRST